MNISWSDTFDPKITEENSLLECRRKVCTETTTPGSTQENRLERPVLQKHENNLLSKVPYVSVNICSSLRVALDKVMVFSGTALFHYRFQFMLDGNRHRKPMSVPSDWRSNCNTTRWRNWNRADRLQIGNMTKREGKMLCNKKRKRTSVEKNCAGGSSSQRGLQHRVISWKKRMMPGV